MILPFEIIVKILIFLAGYFAGGVSVYLFLRGKITKDTITKEEIVSYLLIIMWLVFQGISFFSPEFQLDWIFNALGFGVIGHVLGIKLPLPNMLKK